tara:strand:- start:1114 stop:1758 length:645 start_codon:yes stop_codon:yes gene_type:complete
MSQTELVWLSSYPRSGNTFLRTILWQCFGQRSGSIYPRDLGGKPALEEYVGHVEHAPSGKINFLTGNLPLVKTHEHDKDEAKAIYVVRDGRAACVSFKAFYKERVPLEEILFGKTRFGSWGDNVNSWRPWERANTLFLKYEDIRDDLPSTLTKISVFLDCDILKHEIPQRDTIAKSDGQWVRRRTDWRDELQGELLERFNQENWELLKRLDYVE